MKGKFLLPCFQGYLYCYWCWVYIQHCTCLWLYLLFSSALLLLIDMCCVFGSTCTCFILFHMIGASSAEQDHWERASKCACVRVIAQNIPKEFSYHIGPPSTALHISRLPPLTLVSSSGPTSPPQNTFLKPCFLILKAPSSTSALHITELPPSLLSHLHTPHHPFRTHPLTAHLHQAPGEPHGDAGQYGTLRSGHLDREHPHALHRVEKGPAVLVVGFRNPWD